MFMIDYVTPEKADGAVGKIYSSFPPEVGVPASLQVFSASPSYMIKQMAIIKSFMENDGYDKTMLAALRYVGASSVCFGFCTDFNRNMLEKMGLKKEEIEALQTDPSKGFEPREAALIEFVSKAIATPDEVTQPDVDAVRGQGWTDEQIFECTAYAAQMATLGIVYRTFVRK